MVVGRLAPIPPAIIAAADVLTTGDKARRRKVMWALIVLASLTIFCCCGGAIGLSCVGWSDSEDEVKARFGEHPTIVSRIGPIESVSFDWARTLDSDDVDYESYHLEGSRGEAHLDLSVPLTIDEQMRIEEAVLFHDGERAVLDLDLVDVRPRGE